jgi:hypothetical protein
MSEDEEEGESMEAERGIERILSCKNLETLYLHWGNSSELTKTMALRVDNAQSLLSLSLQHECDISADRLDSVLEPTKWKRIAKSLRKLRALGYQLNEHDLLPSLWNTLDKMTFYVSNVP